MKKDKNIIGSCGVDSGQLLIIDPCYLSKWEDGEFYADENKKIDNDYARACEITCGKEMGGEIRGGVVLSTGYGDGCYDVEVEKQDGRIKSLKIKFF